MLYENFTARQNLYYFARLGGKRNLTRDDYYACMRRVGLQEEAFEMKLGKFSKGMRQKLGIAIAVVKDAANILLDEPTSGLDPKSAAEFIDILKELRNGGKSILMSTHDIFRAREIADTVGIMRKGQLVMVKTKEEFHGEDLESVYLEYMQTVA
jgi:ABC-2 type transport system ATP-binding protein